MAEKLQGVNCSHIKTKIWEPHLAGARKCLHCGMVYNPNRDPSWFFEEQEKPVNKGIKYDQDKIRTDLLSAVALEEVSKVLTFGAKKYGPNNWRYGMHWSRLIGATLRHIFAFMRREDLDEETGLSHIAHAMCCLMFLLEFQKRKSGCDDRWDEAHKMPKIKEYGVNIKLSKETIEKLKEDHPEAYKTFTGET